MQLKKITLNSGIYYKNSERTFQNGKSYYNNQPILPRKTPCCGKKSDGSLHPTGEVVQVYKPNRECCKRIVRPGTNSNVSLQPRSNSNTLIYKKNDNITYFHNTAQRLKARNMSYQTNLPTQKNNTLSNKCCRDSSGKLITPSSKAQCCHTPIDKTKYGMYTKAGTTSGDRIFGLRTNNNKVYSVNNTEEQKKPNKKCLNKAGCYK